MPTMKIMRITFSSSDTELKPSEGKTIPETMSLILARAIGRMPTRDASIERKKWEILDVLEASTGIADLTRDLHSLLIELWEIAMPHDESAGYRWKRAIDESIRSAEAIQVEPVAEKIEAVSPQD